MEVASLSYTTMGGASHYLNSDDRNYTTTAFTTSSGDNTTEDIVRAGCLVDPFSLVACIRYSKIIQSIIVIAWVVLYLQKRNFVMKGFG